MAYLYDMPPETLGALLKGGEVVTYAPDEVIVHKGAVTRGEPPHFQIVTDGRVSVRDGRRVIARLAKADTFGEWGISHQRGSRVADVITERPTQTVRLSEEQYYWLVGKHPVVQERISKIRSLLPRLQLAQERGRLKAASDPRARSVVEDMTLNQLSTLAIFSKVETFKQGHLVTVHGDEADGFYILLSGHLAAGIEGRPVGELSEGDVFGELGLRGRDARGHRHRRLRGCRGALHSFQHLLRTVPAFAWGIPEAAAGRRELIRGPAAP